MGFNAKEWRLAHAFDEIEVRTEDRTTLRAVCLEPDAPPRASIVLSHAMFARKSSLRSLAAMLAGEGFRAVAFDFRGHGDSTPSLDYRYDDLVARDLPAVVECVRARADDHPVIVLGHSLGAHVALAAQGTGRMSADAIVMLGGNVWLRELEPSAVRWAAKVAIARASLAVADRAGRMPAKTLRIGSDDAATPYLQDLFRGVATGRWTSDDGTDYLAAAANVKVPVAAILGDADRVMCHRGSGERFARHCGGPVRILHTPEGHMALRHAHTAVREALAWALPIAARPAGE